MKNRTISVQTENIFPIIKKFLYSDHEIFLRELVSNAVDATAKLKAMAAKGDIGAEIGDTHIEILLDEQARTLTIRDRGVGMSADEIQRYLNQIAFSSASEFLEKYKDSGIIGHFGLGFYSAFMVADKVEVVSKSWRDDEPAVKWTCHGDPEFSIEPVEKAERGTDVTLYINEENKQFAEKRQIEDLLRKYCSFLPVPIIFGTETETYTEGDEAKELTRETPRQINDTHPIWKKSASELSEQDYPDFYDKLYPYSPRPLFWIHLNIDYPFNLSGVLYFPQLGNLVENTRNKIHLYSNQVYVTDDVRNIVPEWLQLLHGVIDSPDIPLNVSRSYLQSDANVRKISEYITRKVADKLAELFRDDRKAYEEKWRALGVFVKYGMVSDSKFQEKAMNFALVENTDREFFLLSDYKERVKAAQTNKHDKTVFLYTHNHESHAALIKAAKARGYDVLRMDTVLDNHWMQHLEHQSGLDVLFARIDSDTLDNLIPKDEKRESALSEEAQTEVKSLFEKVVSDPSSIRLEALSPADMPVQLTMPEFMRRFKEMQMLHRPNEENDMPDMFQVTINTNHPAIAAQLLALQPEAREASARYLYDLARLQSGILTGDDLSAFIERSLERAFGSAPQA